MKKEKNPAFLWKIAAFVEAFLLIIACVYFGKVYEEKNKPEEIKQLENVADQVSVTPHEKKEKLSEEEIYAIAEEGLKKYRLMFGEYFMTNLQTEKILNEENEVTIQGEGGYYLVMDERYSTVQEVKDYIETICTKEHAEKLYTELWHLEGERPFLAELDGRLYTQCVDGPFGRGELYVPLAYLNEEGDIVFFYKCVHEEDTAYEWQEEGIMSLEKQNGVWYTKSVEKWK